MPAASRLAYGNIDKYLMVYFAVSYILLGITGITLNATAGSGHWAEYLNASLILITGVVNLATLVMWACPMLIFWIAIYDTVVLLIECGFLGFSIFLTAKCWKFHNQGYWGYWDGWESLSGCADAENYRLVGMFITSFASLTIVICNLLITLFAWLIWRDVRNELSKEGRDGTKGEPAQELEEGSPSQSASAE